MFHVEHPNDCYRSIKKWSNWKTKTKMMKNNGQPKRAIAGSNNLSDTFGFSQCYKN